MATNNYNIRVRVTDGGDIGKIEQALKGLGATVVRARQNTSEAGKAATDLNRIQGQGIIGTANSTKSFSKLAETIGSGGGGLVGAYATLAANIFAVTAGFNALRNASQVEQVFRGLEAAGTRVGLSLNSTAKALREVAGDAISAEQAMRATAQITSAGFNEDTVRKLGQAARDTSFALGRNMTDSLERLTRGVVKLEPELLDELGIMTKLTESNMRYAQQLGKTESQLSNFERRQGFLNAVVAEAELKFGGLSAAAGDSTNYDKLAATFSDLTTEVMNVVNVFAKPFAGVLASSSTLISGLGLLFASTLRGQLLPGLVGASTQALRTAQSMKTLASEKLEAVTAAKELATVEARQALTSRMNFSYIGDNGPKTYRQLAAAVRDGTASYEDQEKAVRSLEKSVAANQRILDNHVNFQQPGPKRSQKEAEIEATNREIAAIRALQAAQVNAANTNVQNSEKVTAAQRAARAAGREALSAQASAASLGAASQLKLGESWKQLVISTKAYSSAQQIAGAQGLTAMIQLRTAAFATAGAVKAIGVAFLSALPWIGLVATAIGLVVSAYNSLKSDAIKKLEAALESFNEVSAKAVQYGNEIARANDAQVSSSIRAASALTIQSNAVREITDNYQKVLQARERVDSEGIFKNLLDGITQGDNSGKVASFWETLGQRSVLSYQLGIRKNSEILNIADSVAGFAGKLSQESSEALKVLNSLNEAAPKDLERWVKQHYGSWAQLNKEVARNPNLLASVAQSAAQSLDKAFGDGSEKIKSFQEAMTQLETDLSKFYRSAAISTPFDDVVKSASNANNAIMALADTYRNSNQWKDLLTGLDANTSSSLSPALQEQLKLYREADAIVQSLTNKTGERTEAERASLGIAQKRLDNNRGIRDQIQSEILGLERTFVLAQEITRQNASQLRLLQAQAAANGEIYKAGAAGAKAKLADEEKVRGIQKQQLSIQIDVLKNSVTINENRAYALKLQIQENEQILASIDLSKQKGLQDLRNALALKGITDQNLKAFERLGNSRQAPAVVGRMLDPDTANQVDAYLDSTKAINKANADLIKQKTELRAAEQASRDILASIKSLSTQIQEIDAAAPTAAEKQARLQRAELGFRKEALNILRQQEKTASDLNSIYQETSDIINGTSSTIRSQIDASNRAASLQRAEAARSYNDRKLELATALKEAEAQQTRANLTKDQRAAANALVQVAKEAIVYAEQGYALDLRRIDAENQRNIAQRVYFDTAREGVEWQRTGLDMLQRQLDVSRQLSDETLKNSELRVKLEAKRQGYTLDRQAEESLQIKAASESYRLALQESSLKKALIDLEFALLEQQRDQLKAELEVRRTNIDPSNITAINQIDSTLEKISRVDFGALATGAKKVVDVALENSRLALEEAMTPIVKSTFGSVAAAADGYRRREEARRQAQQTLSTPGPVSERVVGPANPESGVTPLLQRMMADNAALLKSISDQISKESARVDATVIQEVVNPIAATIQDAAKLAVSRGFRVSEMSGYGGVNAKAHTGRGHVEGRAFDLNIGTGNVEANDPQMRARMDQMAEDFRKMGFTVLWKVAGHFNHMHVEMGKAVSATAKITERYIEKATTKLETTEPVGEEVVVKASRRTNDYGADLVANDNTPIKLPEAPRNHFEGITNGIIAFRQATSETLETLRQLGPEGEVVATITEGMANLGDSVIFAMNAFKDSTTSTADRFTAVAGVASSAIATISSALASSAQAKEAAVQREIDAEQRRDGKSAESVAKIAALEKRKDEIAKKQFNTNKKLMMAQAVMSTAAGVAQALSYGPILGPILAGVIGAMGAAQIAIISGTQYQSSGSSAVASEIASPSLTIGRRGDSVDLARQNNNVGGELGYLRGTPGRGSNSSNYSVIGSAYGGDVPRGYGKVAYSFNEKGPETMEMPDVPVTIRPSNDNNSGVAPISATIEINALDASGVEQVLERQQGNIIQMLRRASNASGQPFMEDVNISTLSRPNSANRL